MKIKDARDAYGYNTGKVGDLVRQLGFAGIAVVWIFKVGATEKPVLTAHLLSVLAYFVITLSCDLLQYVSGSIIWGSYQWYKGDIQQVDTEADFRAPRVINWPLNFFFWLKTIFLLRGYYLLLKFMYYRLFFQA